MARYIDSKYARGPKRWERAALNAARRPHSAAAALYYSRVSVAREVGMSPALLKKTRTPFEFTGPSYNYDPATRRVTTSRDKRMYVTCSVYCTVMQMTLDFGTTDKGVIAGLFAGGNRYGRKVQPLTTKANRRCQVCGTQVVHA